MSLKLTIFGLMAVLLVAGCSAAPGENASSVIHVMISQSTGTRIMIATPGTLTGGTGGTSTANPTLSIPVSALPGIP